MHPTLRALGRRIQLTTKDTNKGYYKGNRTGSMGSHTKYGTYKIDYNKVRTYVVPDLDGFKLTPFVTKKLEISRKQYEGYALGPLSGEHYLKMWKAENGDT